MPKLTPGQRGQALPAEGLFVLLSGTLLVAALLLGGATREGELWNAFVRLLSLPVLFLALYRLTLAPGARLIAAPLVILAAIIAVPLVQLAPLPPWVWEHLPGRSGYAETFRAVGMAPPWLPISLDPERTLNALLALLPPAAMFTAMLTLDDQARRRFLFAIVVVATAALLLGLAQLLEGPETPFRLYESTNRSAAVGFFANRNHEAGFLLAVLPVATLWAVMSWKRWRADRAMAIIFGVALFVALIAGAAMSKSRAGLLLLPPAVIACLLLVMSGAIARASRRALLVGMVILIAAVCGGTLVLALKFDVASEISADMRATALPGIVTAALEYFPLGSGLGTFEDIYRTQERPESLSHAFLNHAHNDFLEIWLETGLAGPVLIVAFLIWFGARVAKIWRVPEGENPNPAHAATIVVGLLLAHSLVDYPLRTAALSTLFAMACGLLISPIHAQNRPAPAPEVARQLPPRRFQLRGRR